jgi:hypothetical protein
LPSYASRKQQLADAVNEGKVFTIRVYDDFPERFAGPGLFDAQ